MSSTITAAQWRVWAELLDRQLTGRPSIVDQIDLERERDGVVVAWLYFQHDDDEFAVSFKQPGPMPDGEIRRLLTRDPIGASVH